MSVAADSAAVADGLARVLARDGIEIDFLVDCDTGLGRTGVQTPEEAAELAAHVAGLDGLRFGGLMIYPSTPESGPWVQAARTALERAGLGLEHVSGGGTPNARRSHEVDGVTEVRAGTYVYGDRACIANGSVRLADCALRVRATVVSRPTRERAIVDAGSKTLTSDPAAGTTGHGYLVEHPEAEVYALSEEHGWVDVSRCEPPPEIGDVVTIVPNHGCGAANLHDEIVVHRGGEIVATWPTAARGKVR